jgi:hypothetical protein
LVIGAVLVAPVVLLSGGTSAPPCAHTLLYQGRRYVARPVAPDATVEAVAIGVGVESGCGASPSNVDLRSLVGVKPAAAVGLPADDSSIYVRRGLCPASSARDLVACLRR